MRSITKFTSDTRVDSAFVSEDDGSVWVVVSPHVMDLATWIWWWFAPFDRKGYLVLTLTDGTKLRTKALCVAIGTQKVRGVPHA